MKMLISIFVILLLLFSQSHAQWVQQISGISVWLKSVHFTSNQNGWIVGESGTILKTTNAGANWTTISLNITNDLSTVFL